MEQAEKQIALFESQGFGNLPICMAKTQYSFTGDATIKVRRDGEIPVHYSYLTSSRRSSRSIPHFFRLPLLPLALVVTTPPLSLSTPSLTFTLSHRALI